MSGEFSREALERPDLFGEARRSLHVSEARVVVELCACTGEPVERRESTLLEVIACVRSPSGGAEHA